MEKLFMSAGIVTTIVVCLIGIIKLPFNNFKEKHPKTYKAIFTYLAFTLSIVLSVLDEIYILCGSLLSIDFAILICVVLSGVFGGYCGVYEGLGAKELVKKIKEKLKQAKELATNKKVVKILNKIDNVNIDNAIAILQERKNSEVGEV